MAFPWTADKREEMKEMWADGKSASQIARFLSEKYDAPLSRCAVMGAIHRLGEEVRESLRPLRKPKKDKVATAPKPKPKPQPQSVVEPPVMLFHKPIPAPEPPMNVNPEELKPTIESIMDLGERNCRWPYGDRNFTYCGRKRTAGSAYCCAHHQLSRREDRYGRRKLGHPFSAPVQGNSIVVKGPEQQGGERDRKRSKADNKPRLQWLSAWRH